MTDARSITVKVLGRDYQVACPPEERDALYAAARYLDDRMIAIRRKAAGLGLERIAIMTALNMARELMQYERTAPVPVPPSKVTPITPDLLNVEAAPSDSEPESPADKPAKKSEATTDSDRIAQLSLTIRDALSDD